MKTICLVERGVFRRDLDRVEPRDIDEVCQPVGAEEPFWFRGGFSKAAADSRKSGIAQPPFPTRPVSVHLQRNLQHHRLGSGPEVEPLVGLVPVQDADELEDPVFVRPFVDAQELAALTRSPATLSGACPARRSNCAPVE